MRTVKFVNSRGEELYISPGALPYSLGKITGTGGEGVTANNRFEKAPYQDGSTYLDTDLETRDINLIFDILTDTEEEANTRRREAARILNPKLGAGELFYTTQGTEYRIEAVATSPVKFLDGKENRSRGHQKCEISFECPDPYWTDPKETTTPMAAFTGLFQFPLQLPTQMGIKGDRQIFNNQGDEATPVYIEFKGPAVDPKVTNETTGEFIQVNRELLATDTLYINTAFGDKRAVIINEAGEEVNVFNWIDEDSTFFQLVPGENEISYTATSGDFNAIVSIKWRNKYIGV